MKPARHALRRAAGMPRPAQPEPMQVRTMKPLALSAALAALLGLAACGGPAATAKNTPHAAPAKAHRVIEVPTNGSLITVPATSKFALVRAKTDLLSRTLTAPGIVAPDISRTVQVYSLANGYATKVPVQLGDQVKKGQVLATVDSPQLADAISDYQTAQAALTYSVKELAREKGLYSHGAAPEKAVQLAQLGETKARVQLRTAVREIHVLGGSVQGAGALSPHVAIRSPIAGTIIQQNIAAGEEVGHGSLFTVADLSRVWVLCSVYENDLDQVHLGDRAKIALNAYPNLRLYGRVSNISRVLNPQTRTAQVRVVLSNHHGLLEPQMFASVTFSSVRTRRRVVLPPSALFQLHDSYWVFLPKGKGRFLRVPVQAGAIAPDGWQIITRGLTAGQQVVRKALKFASLAAQEKR